jgi:hypothetical protein
MKKGSQKLALNATVEEGPPLLTPIANGAQFIMRCRRLTLCDPGLRTAFRARRLA